MNWPACQLALHGLPHVALPSVFATQMGGSSVCSFRAASKARAARGGFGTEAMTIDVVAWR